MYWFKELGTYTEKDGLVGIKGFHFQLFLSYIEYMTKENDSDTMLFFWPVDMGNKALDVRG